MKRVSTASLVAGAVVAAHLQLGAAESARLRYQAVVYADSKGAGLNLPEGVACDASGQVVVGDTGNDRLLRFTFRDRTIAGGSEVKVPQLTSPVRVQLGTKGDIYALDGKQRQIVQLAANGEFKGVVKFEGAPAAGTVVPKSFTVDASGNIYVLDVFSARVLILNEQAQVQRALALPAGNGFISDLAVDPSGTLFLLDSVNRRLFSAPKDATTFTPLGGDLSQFIATLPTYLTTARGVIFIVEGRGSTIVGLGRDGSFLSRQLTMGWNEGALNHPGQICVNEKDDVFVADRDNSRVQVFQLMR